MWRTRLTLMSTCTGEYSPCCPVCHSVAGWPPDEAAAAGAPLSPPQPSWPWVCLVCKESRVIHSLLYLSLPLCIYLAENIQTSAGDDPSNTRECQTPNHRQAKTYFWLVLATPIVGVAWNSWKHCLRWPVVWILSHTYTLDHFVNNDDPTIFWPHKTVVSLGQY